MIPKEFASLVVEWFRKEGRLLPWREGRNPYRIWISEVMLQQTRIEAVIPYYHRFLHELPDLAALADCPEDKLLKLWEGLGYYSRARNLKKAAVKVMTDFGGEMPRDVKALRSLSGIGDYTAGAIGSIAFGLPAPAVDGNVLRVMTRVLGDESDIALPETKKKIDSLLESVYPTGSAAGDLTEGIMEIGERVCIPAGVPLCTVCPLKKICASKGGLWERIPVKSPKKERKVLEKTVFVLDCNGEIAIRRRPEGGLLAGMWEFYSVDRALSHDDAKKHLTEQGFEPKELISLGKATHIFTHLEWHMTGYLVHCDRKQDGFLWERMERIDEAYAIPTALQKIKKKAKEKAV